MATIGLIVGIAAAAIVIPAVTEGIVAAKESSDQKEASLAQTKADEKVSLADIKEREHENDAIADAAEALGKFESGLGGNHGHGGPGQVA